MRAQHTPHSPEATIGQVEVPNVTKVANVAWQREARFIAGKVNLTACCLHLNQLERQSASERTVGQIQFADCWRTAIYWHVEAFGQVVWHREARSVIAQMDLAPRGDLAEQFGRQLARESV